MYFVSNLSQYYSLYSYILAAALFYVFDCNWILFNLYFFIQIYKSTCGGSQGSKNFLDTDLIKPGVSVPVVLVIIPQRSGKDNYREYSRSKLSRWSVCNI